MSMERKDARLGELLGPKLLILLYPNPGSTVESCSWMKGASTAGQKKQISFLGRLELRCAMHARCGSTFPSSYHLVYPGSASLADALLFSWFLFNVG
jgi:hypothetical protein